MLRGIPSILSPELLKVMQEMGHGDVIILVDANFPAASNAQRLIRLDGVGADDLLSCMLEFFPLDAFVEHPVSVMQPIPGVPIPPIWQEYERIVKEKDFSKAFTDLNVIERMEFYAYAKEAYAIVQTGTTAHYANIGLKKGAF